MYNVVVLGPPVAPSAVAITIALGTVNVMRRARTVSARTIRFR